MQLAHAITKVDKTFRFLEVDDDFCELLQISRKNIFNRSIIDVTHEADRCHNEEMLHRLVEHGTSFKIYKRYKRDDGTIIRVENRVSRALSARGEARLVASVRPLNDYPIERMLAEAKALSEEIQYRTKSVKKFIKNFG